MNRWNVLILFFSDQKVNLDGSEVLIVPVPYDSEIRLCVVVGVLQFLRLDPLGEDRLSNADHAAELRVGKATCRDDVINFPSRFWTAE